MQVSEQDRSCLRFHWRPTTNETVQLYEYQRHVVGAKSSPTCANYALKPVGLDNQEMYPIAAKAIQSNFYMDDFIKSVETLEGATEVIKQFRDFLPQKESQLTKWISSSDEVCKATPVVLKQSATQSNLKWSPIQKDLQCLDYNGLLLMIVFRCVEVPTKKLKHL